MGNLSSYSGLALSIKGNKIRSAGFRPIVSIGLFPEAEGNNMDRTSIASNYTSENPIYVLKNTENYVLYLLLDGMVKTSDTDDIGRLSIGLAIPSNLRLKDKSPYTLLKQIYNKYKNDYMVPVDGGYFKFTEKGTNDDDFSEIIQSYPLEASSSRLAVMSGEDIGLLQVPENELESFFHDTQYPEFTTYKEIHVTTQGKNQFDIKIPRPKSYQVWVNGEEKFLDNEKKKGVLLTKDNDEYLAHQASTDDYEYESLKITLGKLKASPSQTLRSQNGNSVARLDENNDRIVCELNPIEKWYFKEIHCSLDSDDDAEKYVKENLDRIKILIDGTPWEEKRIVPSKAKRAFAKKSISIRPSETEDFTFEISGSTKIDGNKLNIVIKAKNKHKKNVNSHTESNNGKSSSFNPTWFIIGILVGLVLGAGGMWTWRHLRDNRTENQRIKNLQKEEGEAYQTVLNNVPMGNSNVISIEKEDPEYLQALKTDIAWRNYDGYLQKYSKENNPDCYNEQNYKEITKKWEKFQKDSTDYARYDSIQKAKNEKYVQEESAVYNKCKEAANKTGSKYKPDDVISFCNDYLNANYIKLLGESYNNHQNEVSDWKRVAEEKKGFVKAENEKKENARKEMLNMLNQQQSRELKKVAEGNGKYKDYLSSAEKVAYDWILNYSKKDIENKIKVKIELYLKNKWGFPGNSFTDWDNVKKARADIEKITNGTYEN